jgi:hypothetical protein
MPYDTHSIYDELAAYTLTLGDPEFIHQHYVDARGASDDLVHAKPIRILFALAGLYLMLEKDWTGREVQLAHIHMARQRQTWPTFTLPKQAPAFTVEDVLAEPAGPKRNAAITTWCQSVWETWDHEHAYVREVTDALVANWSPKSEQLYPHP